MNNTTENREGVGLTARIRCQKKTFILDVDISLPMSGVSSIIGPSGAGKTTLLRCIAGLETFEGDIRFGECDWQTSHSRLPVHKRDLAFIFQDAGLFSHLTVDENITYAEKRAKKKERVHRRSHIIDILNIGHTLNQSVDTLSGGEAQRVALARALLSQPRCILMDEPLSSLDVHHKAAILPYLITIKEECQQAIVYVSHDLHEHAQLGDYAIVLKAGKIIRSGDVLPLLASPDLYQHCAQSMATTIVGTVTKIDTHWKLAEISFDGGALWVENVTGHEALAFSESPAQTTRKQLHIHQTVRVSIQASDVSISLQQDSNSSIMNAIQTSITHITPIKDSAMCFVQSISRHPNNEGVIFFSRITQRSVTQLQLQEKMPIWLHIKTAALIL